MWQDTESGYRNQYLSYIRMTNILKKKSEMNSYVKLFLKIPWNKPNKEVKTLYNENCETSKKERSEELVL